MNKAELVAQQLLGGNLNKVQWGSAMYNVLSEGLAGGGVVDDTAKLQVLVDKAIAEGRKAIFFPHGTNGQYRVTALTNADQVVFFGDNASFVGGYLGTIHQLGEWASATDIMPVFNVKKYGEIGIGNDTAVIQSAINAAVAAGGGEVFLPRGTYDITGPTGGNFLTLKSKVRMRGAGIGVTILKLGTVSGLSNSMLWIETNAVDAGISNLTVEGSTTQIQHAILADKNIRPKIQDIQFINYPCTLGVLYIKDSKYGRFENIDMDLSVSNKPHGLCLMSTVVSSADYHTVSNCTVIDGGFAFRTLHSGRNTFTNCCAIGTTGSNVTSLEGFNISGGVNNNFVNCQSYLRGDGGYIENNLTEPGYPPGDHPRQNKVTGFTSYRNFLCGLSLTGKEGVYTDIISYNNAQWRVLDPGNSATFSGQDDGVQVYSSASDIILNSITTYDSQGTKTQQYGLRIMTGANKTHVTNHKHYGNVVAGLYDENTIQDNTVYGLSSNDIKFSVNKNAVNQSIPTNANTLITWSTESYDVGGCFSNNRFTPTRPGRYELNVQITFSPIAAGNTVFLMIYKNGVLDKETRYVTTNTLSASMTSYGVVEANGTTDYFEVFILQNNAANMDITGASRLSTWYGRYIG